MITTRIAKTLAGAAFALLGLTAIALAAPAYITAGTELRAGPGANYPPVAGLPPGTPVEVFGCLQGWTWCDVAAETTRGWVSGGDLQISYGDRRVLLPGYGPVIGLPVIGFDFGDYWGRYYRDRPWFRDQDRWRGLAGPGYGGPVYGRPGFRDHRYDGPGYGGPGYHRPEFGGPGFQRHGGLGFGGPGFGDRGYGERGHEDRGHEDRGREDRGHQDRGREDRGHEDRGHEDRGHQDRGHQDRGREDRDHGARGVPVDFGRGPQHPGASPGPPSGNHAPPPGRAPGGDGPRPGGEHRGPDRGHPPGR